MLARLQALSQDHFGYAPEEPSIDGQGTRRSMRLRRTTYTHHHLRLPGFAQNCNSNHYRDLVLIVPFPAIAIGGCSHRRHACLLKASRGHRERCALRSRQALSAFAGGNDAAQVPLFPRHHAAQETVTGTNRELALLAGSGYAARCLLSHCRSPRRPRGPRRSPGRRDQRPTACPPAITEPAGRRRRPRHSPRPGRPRTRLCPRPATGTRARTGQSGRR
jgi:hypothetical protein